MGFNIQDESGDKKYFTIIPNYIANHSSANDQALYLQMKKIVGEGEGVCYASEKYFISKLRIGRKALKNSIQYLIDHGWIEDAGVKTIPTQGGIQKTRVYLVKDIWSMNIKHYEGVSERKHLDSKGVAEREPLKPKGVLESTQGVSESTQGVLSGATKKNSNKNNNKNTISSEDKSSPKVNELIDLFEPLNPLTYKKWYANTTQRKAVERLSQTLGEKLSAAISAAAQANTMKYAPTITTPLQLEDKLSALRAFIIKEQSKGKMPLVSKL